MFFDRLNSAASQMWERYENYVTTELYRLKVFIALLIIPIGVGGVFNLAGTYLSARMQQSFQLRYAEELRKHKEELAEMRQQLKDIKNQLEQIKIKMRLGE